MKVFPWQKINVARLMAQSRASEIIMQGVRKSLLSDGFEEILPGEFVMPLTAKRNGTQMTKYQRDNVRAQLAQPSKAPETWWHAIAEQLLHSLEATWDDGFAAADAARDDSAVGNPLKLERQEWASRQDDRG